MTAQRGAQLSLGLGLVVLALKGGAYALSGSVALLSDAAESLVNVAAALAVMISLRVARTPPDYRHPYGHHKAEYLSSAFEGALILLAAAAILVTSGLRLISPEPLEAPLLGVGVALVATLLNGAAHRCCSGWRHRRTRRRSLLIRGTSGRTFGRRSGWLPGCS